MTGILNARIIASVAMLVFVGAAIAASTGAFFSDTESSTGNTFTAGEVDITISNLAHQYSGNGGLGGAPSFTPAGITFALGDLKPQDAGTVTYNLQNASNEIHLCAAVVETGNNENTRLEPETSAGDLTDGANNGELGQFLSFMFNGNTTTLNGSWQSLGIVGGSQATSSAIGYCFGTYTGGVCTATTSPLVNRAQTDSITADVHFYAVQTRNNPGFSCANLDPIGGEPTEPIVWTNDGTRTGGEVSIIEDGSAPDGANVLRLITINDNDSRVRYSRALDFDLDTLTSISFESKQISAPVGKEAVANATLRLFIDLDGDTGTTGDVTEVTYEPYYNIAAYNPLNAASITPGSWQTWNITTAAGKFWANGGFLGSTPSGGAYATNFTLAQVLAAHTDAKVVGISLGLGTYNPSWTIDVDNLLVNGTLLGFE